MERLLINNFKCFKETSIVLNDLTLLIGANGCGKSSVIHSLLLMRSAIEHRGDDRIAVNGPYGLALGTSSAVQMQNASGSTLRFKLEDFSDKDAAIDLTFDADQAFDQLWITRTSCNECKNTHAALLNKEFYYLNAERLGPRITQAITHMDYPTTGISGEFTAQVISEAFKIDERRWAEKSKDSGLASQVNYWLNDIFPGVRVTARTDTKTLSSTVLIENSATKNNPVLATNIGFGISYVLPIIVTGLVAKEGAYFIVENPEAHLHPGAQSKIGQFLGMVAHAGVKVIIETHSDHVLNGIQIYVAKHPDCADRVTVNYFTLDKDFDEPSIQRIAIKPNGELSDWPKGFFDQSQIDYISLSKIRRNV